MRPWSLATSVICAPNARIVSRFSWLNASENTTCSRYPSTAQTSASDIPVVPAVYSTTVPPGGSLPSAAAARMTSAAILSFIDPVGLADSSLTQIRAPDPGAIRFSHTSGVPPIAPSTPGRAYLSPPGPAGLPGSRVSTSRNASATIRVSSSTVNPVSPSESRTSAECQYRSCPARQAATEVNPSPSPRACARSTSPRRITRTPVVSITATGWPAESTTTWRSPGWGSGSPCFSYSATSPLVVVFSPARIAATSRSRPGPGKANSATGRSSAGIAASLTAAAALIL